MIIHIVVMVAMLLWFSLPIQAQTRQTYTVSTENFANPERGFFIQRAPIWIDGERAPLADEALPVFREQGISLIRTYYLLDLYRDQPLDQDIFAAFNADMESVRAAGFKAIVRFAYNFPDNDDYEASLDASLDWVLTHIQQLTPYLRANADVIAHMEAGFVGAWGEWHSSGNGLIDSPERGLNTASRAILDALLTALPETRMIAVRYPLLKQQLFGSEPLEPTQAFSGSAQARLGAHEDCFLASDTNWGTYLNANDDPQIEAFKDYLNADNRYVVQSGETCNDGQEARPFIGCENALGDLKRLRWSSINHDYNQDVLAVWENEGCFDTIARHLGYRISLQTVSAPTRARPGETISIEMALVNDGFASPYNPRGFAVYLRREDGIFQPLRLSETPDPRRWIAAEQLALQVGLPDDLPAGSYELLLHLPDPEPRLTDDPRYALRLANEGLWEAETGFHRLGL